MQKLCGHKLKNYIARWNKCDVTNDMHGKVFCQQGKQTLFLECDKCLCSGRDYVKNYCVGSIVIHELLLLEMKMENPKYMLSELGFFSRGWQIPWIRLCIENIKAWISPYFGPEDATRCCVRNIIMFRTTDDGTNPKPNNHTHNNIPTF